MYREVTLIGLVAPGWLVVALMRSAGKSDLALDEGPVPDPHSRPPGSRAASSTEAAPDPLPHQL